MYSWNDRVESVYRSIEEVIKCIRLILGREACFEGCVEVTQAE